MVSGGGRFVVLMYHAVEDTGQTATSDPGELVYVVRRGSFERQLDLLREAGSPVVTHADLAARLTESGPLPVIVTFDDGDGSNASVALPALLAREMPAVFFITTGWIGTAGHLDEAGIARLHGSGMTIGSHGITHRYLTGLADAELREELSGSKQRLEQIIGSPVDSLSAPGGRIEGRVFEAAAAAGYRYIYGSAPRVNPRIPDGGPIGRFAVTRDLSEGSFRRIAEGDPPVSLRLRHAALSATRRLLGDAGYDRLRRSILGGEQTPRT